MKTLQESIIGRKGTNPTNPTKLWLLYPVNVDYQYADELIPDQCRVYCNHVVLFCVDLQQLKEYFSYKPGFRYHKSVLFEVNPRYLKTFEEVKEWVSRQSSSSDLHNAKELNEIIVTDIPKYIETL